MMWGTIKTLCKCLEKVVYIGYFLLKGMDPKEMALLGPNLLAIIGII
jgi:hypothetical protein